MPPAPTPDQFVAYAENMHGEQMLAIGDQSRLQLFHGDNAWNPVDVVDGAAVALILSEEERAWLASVHRIWVSRNHP
jgi:hypothetical protein